MYDGVKETKKKKNVKLWKNLSLWWHCQIIICVLTARMNNDNVREVCRRKCVVAAVTAW